MIYAALSILLILALLHAHKCLQERDVARSLRADALRQLEAQKAIYGAAQEGNKYSPFATQ